MKGLDLWVKVGFRLFIRDGVVFLDEIRKIDGNFKIFLDLKFYDIFYIMVNVALECVKLEIDMFIVYLSSVKSALIILM